MNLRTITIGIALAYTFVCPSANFYFRTVDVKDGLADNYVRNIVRDHEGYIWISTINGLSRYDGIRFQNFMPMQVGGRANDVTSVSGTADSTLWMVCVNELFTYDRPNGTWKKDGAERIAKLGVKGTVRKYFVDDRHNPWIETAYGLYYYDYSHHELITIPNFNKSPIIHIVSKNGTTIVVTSDYKIYNVSMTDRRLVPIGMAPVKNYNRDSKVFLDSNMNLWIYNSHSIAGSQWIFSLKNKKWWNFPTFKQTERAIINAISEDNDGNIWIGTENAGVHVFDYHGEELVTTDINSMHPYVTHSSHISCFYMDKNNTMWVGSAKLGVAFSDMNCLSFNVVSTSQFEDVSALTEDRKGNLWIGFDGDGILMRSANGTSTHFSALRNQLPSNIITSFAVLGDGSVLTGTYGCGIAIFDGTKFTPLYPNISSVKYVKAMKPDNHGNLWIGTVDNGVVKMTGNGDTANYTQENSSLLSNGILCLACDSLHSIMYIGTSMGVSVFDCTKEQFVEIEPLNTLKGEYISSMVIKPDNTIWIGSRNGLWIYQSKSGTLDHLTTEQGLSHNTIRALAVSGHHIWASTDNGLTAISTESDKEGKRCYKCLMFYDYDGLQDIVFSNNAAMTSQNGRALLGCYTGYMSILPDNIMIHYPKLRVQFTDVRINGGSMQGRALKELSLDYGERPSIFISAMVPALSQKVKYYYRFKGEETWMPVPNGVLYFAQLSPGNHMLQVKAILPSMMESDIAELPIHVAAPFWLSKPAFVLYFLLMIGLGYLVYRISHMRQKREFALKQLEMNLEKYKMEEDKIRFFTNISHDLKTPLTLVVAPLEKIRETNLPAAIRTEVDVAWRNARQLYGLVLELLDFRRLDVGKEKLQMKHGDIVSFVRQTVQGFAFYAIRKQIRMQMKLPTNDVEIYFDENKMRRIITNLLSNAYKYNVDNGMVTVTLEISQELEMGEQQHEARQMVLSVADTGIGVRNKRHIFDRFVQETHGQEQEGNGIGLHIVKQYVDLMRGTIEVTDNKPCGTVFTITLPIDNNVKPQEEILPDYLLESAEEDKLALPASDLQTKPTILVVDDNMDARLFLQRSLADEYNILVAANGSDALKMLSRTDDVSIIISDVMMPVMDGIELFRNVKSDIHYSHIPVILLTAKSDEKNMIESLQEGVADYITKPFSLAVLRLRIKKILEWTNHIHQDLEKGIEIKPSEITVSSLDEELINHVISNIEANMQDTEYSVVQLSSDVGMTRGHLYKKLMAITGKSPLEFIRIIKMKRGKSLLDQGRTNVSEVANMVGLSAKQFAHYFKQMYDVTPSDYLRNIGNSKRYKR